MSGWGFAAARLERDLEKGYEQIRARARRKRGAQDPAARRVRSSLPVYHDGQVRAKQEAARFNALRWARQTGKTTFCEAEAVQHLLEGHHGGYITPTNKYLNPIFRDLKRTLDPITTRCDLNEKLIETSTGGSIEAWSLKDNPDAARGRVYDFLIVEEAGIPKNLDDWWYKTGRATLAVKKGIAWFNGNAKPRGPFNDFYDKGQRGEDGWVSSCIESQENPYFPADELADIRAEYEREDLLAVFDMEYRGIPMRDFGAPFSAVMRCIIDALSDQDPAGWGWDIGEMVDQTIGTALDARGRMCRLVNAREDHGARDLEEIEDVIYRETGDCEASVDATGMGKGTFEALEKRSIRDGWVREYRGSTDLPPSGGIAPRVVDGWSSIYEGFNFNEMRKQELYGGIRRALMRGLIGVLDGDTVEALESAYYVESTRDTGPALKIYVPKGEAKDRVDSLGLAIRAYLRSDRSPIMPELETYTDDELDEAIEEEDELDREIEEELREQLAEEAKSAKRRRDRDAGWT